MALSEEEKVQLAALLAKTDNTQVRGPIFHELVKKTVSVAIEYCILDDKGRVFLVYRKDDEFDGFHMPGTVINDWDTVGSGLKRLLAGEVIKSGGLVGNITEPQPVGWHETLREGSDSTTRHTLALLHFSRFSGEFVPTKEGVGFFPIDALPENTLDHHKKLIERFKIFLNTGQPVLGIGV